MPFFPAIPAIRPFPESEGLGIPGLLSEQWSDSKAPWGLFVNKLYCMSGEFAAAPEISAPLRICGTAAAPASPGKGRGTALHAVEGASPEPNRLRTFCGAWYKN